MVVKVITRMRKMIGFVESCCPHGEGVIIVKKSEPDNS